MPVRTYSKGQAHTNFLVAQLQIGRWLWTQTHASVLIETPYNSEGEDNENDVQSSRMLIQMPELMEQFLELV
jgi:hypothetical protein